MTSRAAGLPAPAEGQRSHPTRVAPAVRENALFPAVLLAVGIAAAVVLLVLTRWGIGLSPDSAAYLAGARGLMEGRGFAFPMGGGLWEPISLWPPFYSIVLAVSGSAVGIGLSDAARWLNALLLGANAIVVALLLRRMRGGGLWIPVLGALLFLVSGDVLTAHGWASSDPLFLFCGLVSLLLLDSYVTEGKLVFLFAAALMGGVGLWARYAGAAFVAAGLLLLLLRAANGRPIRGKMRDVFLFGALAILPMAGWSVRNQLATGGSFAALGRDLEAVRGVSSANLDASYRVISHWFLPGRIPDPLRTGLLLLIIGALASAVALAIARGEDRGRRLALVVFTSMALYAAGLAAARLNVRSFNVEEVRYYVPVYACLLVLSLYGLGSLHDEAKGRLARFRSPWIEKWGSAVLTAGWAVAAAAVLVFHGAEAAKWARESHSEGLGYANESWHSSGLLTAVRRLPGDVPVVSNASDALYVLAGREAFPFPRRSDLGAPPGSTRIDDWGVTVDVLLNRGGVLAAFNEPTRKGQVALDDILGRTALCAMARFPEGALFARCAGP